MQATQGAQQLTENPKAIIRYETAQGEVKLSPAIVRQYLVNGNANITDAEAHMFMQLCKFRRLNPFLREAYLIKYSASEPAQMVVGFDAIKRRATQHPDYRGHSSGIVVVTKSGEVINRIGSLVLPDEELVGAWCTVHRSGVQAFEHQVSESEYNIKRSLWKDKPATMLRKVVTAQALREVFPEETAGMYAPEEFQREQRELPKETIVAAETPEEPTMVPYRETINKAQANALLSVACGDKQIVHDAAATLGYESVDAVRTADLRAVETLIRARFVEEEASDEAVD